MTTLSRACPRGVHVVAVDQIAHWLASRERTQPDEAVPALAEKLEGLFPQATGPWSSLTPAPNTGRRINSNRSFGSTPSWTQSWYIAAQNAVFASPTD